MPRPRTRKSNLFSLHVSEQTGFVQNLDAVPLFANPAPALELGEGSRDHFPDRSDQVSDLLSATLDADGLGPRTGTNVRAWVWDGFLDAATR